MIARRHSKLWIGVAAGIAAAASAAAFAVPGAAQTSGTELHLTATSQKSAEFFPKHRRPVPGDRLGFGDKITGDDTGISRAVCTIVGGRGAGLPCTIWVKLSKGTLAFQAMLPETSHNAPIAVVGGTGAYNGARGTAFATDVSSSKTMLVVDLLP
jgi:hypothetical protein